MDHELKQRLIGAVVVTALCAIFIPMLFDDPVDDTGQLVSELSIPAPVDPGADTADKLPTSAEQVLKKSPDPEPLSIESPDDTLESTGAAEEAAEEPEKQGGSEESLYAESEGYTREDNSAEEVVEHPLKESEDNRPKSRPKQALAEQSFDFAQGEPLSAEVANRDHKAIAAKAQAKDIHVAAAANELTKVKKVVETVKPTVAKDGGSVAIGRESMLLTVKKPENEQPMVAKDSGSKVGALGDVTSRSEFIHPKADKSVPTQPSTAKSLAAAVAEANKPTVAPKASPKLVRWYIQLGSFSKKENAMSLWESLHEQGLPASLDTVQTDKGTSYRLRLGPELDGKKAAAMKSRLDKQNIKAILISE